MTIYIYISLNVTMTFGNGIKRCHHSIALYFILPGIRYSRVLIIRPVDNFENLNEETFTKSGRMLGLGESEEDVAQVMDGLIAARVDFPRISQYLAPSPLHSTCSCI